MTTERHPHTHRTLLALAVLVLFGSTATALAATPLSTATIEVLEHMVTEEKLAHDVYVTLGDGHDVTTFDRIATSEARHTDAVRALLEGYGVDDPTAGDAVGVFDDPYFQGLYDDLVAQGEPSLAAAAGVGILIEELDIADLREAIAQDHAADVIRVLSNLLRGSEHHLAAFQALAADPAAADGGRANAYGAAASRGPAQRSDVAAAPRGANRTARRSPAR
jgi:hypothetical protein